MEGCWGAGGKSDQVFKLPVYGFFYPVRLLTALKAVINDLTIHNPSLTPAYGFLLPPNTPNSFKTSKSNNKGDNPKTQNLQFNDPIRAEGGWGEQEVNLISFLDSL